MNQHQQSQLDWQRNTPKGGSDPLIASESGAKKTYSSGSRAPSAWNKSCKPHKSFNKQLIVNNKKKSQKPSAEESIQEMNRADDTANVSTDFEVPNIQPIRFRKNLGKETKNVGKERNLQSGAISQPQSAIWNAAKSNHTARAWISNKPQNTYNRPGNAIAESRKNTNIDMQSMQPMETRSMERQQRFENASEGHFTKLRALREDERRQAIRDGQIDDPSKPKQLNQALNFIGTCQDMCPEFEREQREYQKNLEKWEVSPITGKVDCNLAVKAFHRPAAGNEQALPSDVRPPSILVSTLDYLLEKIVNGPDSLENTHFFVRDRTRSIRQDFTLQNYRGKEAIDCHERIARYHILCLHQLCQMKGFSEQQEIEQLRKVLQSLQEFYNDSRKRGQENPNEAEFHAYTILVNLREADMMRQAQLLPEPIFLSKEVQQAIKLFLNAQNNNARVHRLIQRNTVATLNFYTLLFRNIASERTSYLAACIMETHFPAIRRGALKAMRKVYSARHNPMPIEDLINILGFEDAEEAALNCENYGIDVVRDELGIAIGAALNRAAVWNDGQSTVKQTFSRRIVDIKRGNRSYLEVIKNVPCAESPSSLPKLISTRKLKFDKSTASPIDLYRNRTKEFSEPIDITKSKLLISKDVAYKDNSKEAAKLFDSDRYSKKELNISPSPLFKFTNLEYRERLKPSSGLKDISKAAKSILESNKKETIELYEKTIGKIRAAIFKSMIREEIYDIIHDHIGLDMYVSQLKKRTFKNFIQCAHSKILERKARQEKLLARYKRQQLHRSALHSIFTQKNMHESMKGTFVADQEVIDAVKNENIIPILEKLSKEKSMFWEPIENLDLLFKKLYDGILSTIDKLVVVIVTEDIDSFSSIWLRHKLKMKEHSERSFLVDLKRQNGDNGDNFLGNPQVEIILADFLYISKDSIDYSKVCAVVYDAGVINETTKDHLQNSDEMEILMDQIVMTVDHMASRLHYQVPFLLICWSEITDIDKVLSSYDIPDLLFGAKMPYNSFHLLQITRFVFQLDSALATLAENITLKLSCLGREALQRETVKKRKLPSMDHPQASRNLFTRSIFDNMQNSMGSAQDNSPKTPIALMLYRESRQDAGADNGRYIKGLNTEQANTAETKKPRVMSSLFEKIQEAKSILKEKSIQ